MRKELTAVLVLLGVVMAGEVVGQERESREEKLRRICSAEQSPRFFCKVHEVSFEPVEVPVQYGLPFTEVVHGGYFGFQDMVRSERECRFAIASKSEFPNAAPRHRSGGCVVFEDSPKTDLTCACRLCTDAHRQWKWKCSYCNSSSNGAGREEDNQPPVETALFLRIQQLRAFEETEVADCLQRVWDREFEEE